MLKLALLLATSVVGGISVPGVPGVLGVPGAAPAAESGAVEDPSCEPPEPGFLTLDTAPWTQVYVDGEYAGSTPLYRHKLSPGEHRVTLVNQGREVNSEELVVIDEGRLRKLKLILSVEESTSALDASNDTSMSEDDCIVPVDQAAALSVDTQPWSRVYLDGRLMGSTPLFKATIAAGDHVVRLMREDGSSAFARFSASPGETIKLSFALK